VALVTNPTSPSDYIPLERRCAFGQGEPCLHFGSVDLKPVMSSDRYRRNAEECLNRAAEARRSEDTDAWLLIAEEWLKLAVEFDAAGTWGPASKSILRAGWSP
jgi:hypothetical protein